MFEELSSEQVTRRVFARRSMGVAVAAGAAAFGLSASGCGNSGASAAGDDPLAAAKERGHMRVGFANENPYGYADPTGKLTGEAPTVAGSVMKELGVSKLDGVLTTFDALIPGLKAGRFDMVTAGMFITPERCQEVLFSDPDYCITDAFAVRRNDPKSQGIVDLPTLAKSKAKAGTTKGGVIIDQAAKNGVKKSRIQIFPDDNSGIDALKSGRIDVFMGTSLTIRNDLKTAKSSDLEITAPFIPVVDGAPQLGCGGYVFRQSDKSFRDQFNAKLKELQQSGRLLTLVKPFGFGDSEVKTAMKYTAAQLCKA